MSIKTPKYVVQQATEEPSFVRKHWLMFSLIGLAVFTFLIGRYSNIDMLNAFKGQKETWDVVNQQLTQENETQRKTISMLKTEALIQDQAIIDMQKTMANLTQEKEGLKSELAFYENLLSQKNDIKTLRVFDIEITQLGEMTQLKLVLAQKLQKAQMVSGQIKMELKGLKGDQGEVINLVDQYKLDEAFSFKYFQVKKYTISLPKGFNPTTLLVELKSNNKKQKVVSEQFQWSELLNHSPTDLTDTESVNAN